MTAPRKTGRDPLHSFRVRDELWQAARVKATERNEALSSVLVKALEGYVKR